MFAIVKLGNQQFRVKAGDFIRAPFQDNSVNDNINIPVVAFSGDKDFVFDSSKLKGSQVKALIIRQSLGKKVLVFKKKRRQGYRRTRGHRQKITELKILELISPEGKVSKAELKKPLSSSKTKKENKAKTTVKKASAKKTKEKLTKKAVTKKASVDKKVTSTKKG